MDGGGAAFPTVASASHYLGHQNAMKPALTVAENLGFWRDFSADAEAKPGLGVEEALEAVELEARIKAAGGLDAWITQDSLSLGEAQRLNLARAWLSDRPIVLLDEPAEHLDHAQGQRILARLAERLRDRIVVLSSHRATTLPDAVTIGLES